MNLLFWNVLIIGIVAAPILLVQLLRRRTRSQWLKDNWELIGIVAWLATLFLLYVFALPRLGLEPNPSFFRDQ